MPVLIFTCYSFAFLSYTCINGKVMILSGSEKWNNHLLSNQTDFNFDLTVLRHRSLRKWNSTCTMLGRLNFCNVSKLYFVWELHIYLTPLPLWMVNDKQNICVYMLQKRHPECVRTAVRIWIHCFLHCTFLKPFLYCTDNSPWFPTQQYCSMLTLLRKINVCDLSWNCYFLSREIYIYIYI